MKKELQSPAQLLVAKYKESPVGKIKMHELYRIYSAQDRAVDTIVREIAAELLTGQVREKPDVYPVRFAAEHKPEALEMLRNITDAKAGFAKALSKMSVSLKDVCYRNLFFSSIHIDPVAGICYTVHVPENPANYVLY